MSLMTRQRKTACKKSLSLASKLQTINQSKKGKYGISSQTFKQRQVITFLHQGKRKSDSHIICCLKILQIKATQRTKRSLKNTTSVKINCKKSSLTAVTMKLMRNQMMMSTNIHKMRAQIMRIAKKLKTEISSVMNIRLFQLTLS